MNFLIIGNCGVGKTWVLKQLLTNEDKKYKLGKINFHENNRYIIVGKYIGDIFDGSDKLSMSAITDVEKITKYANGKTIIWEGDRFMNSTFIKKINPIVLKILGSGKEGREKRGSKQTHRQIKTIETRVNNQTAHKFFSNSNECLQYIKDETS